MKCEFFIVLILTDQRLQLTEDLVFIWPVYPYFLTNDLNFSLSFMTLPLFYPAQSVI